VEVGVEIVLHCPDFSETPVSSSAPLESAGRASSTIASRTPGARHGCTMQGLHLIADLRDCAGPTALDDEAALAALCLAAVAGAGLRAVGSLFHPFTGPDGSPQGVTGVVLLVESHLAVHTWPELRSVTADVYVCNVGADNSARAEAVMARLVEAFGPREPHVQRVQRG
jgi:S-adenosylmethionine decarboxylase proenzyme